MKLPSNWIKIKSLKKSYYYYIGILVMFFIWMLFLDTHSWTIHSELNNEIEKLEKEKKALMKITDDDKKTIKKLQNKDSLESFAREKYGHKKQNEIVFIIEVSDSVIQP